MPALVAACKDPEIPKWTLVPSPYSEDDARLWLAAQSAARRGGRRVELAIVDLDDRLLGSIAIARLINRPLRELRPTGAAASPPGRFSSWPSGRSMRSGSSASSC